MLFRFCSVVFLALIAMRAGAAESQTLGAWPSTVTTLIMHADGRATFICNSTNAKACNIVILDDACTIAASNKQQSPSCHREHLNHFQIELGRALEMKAASGKPQYCASAADPVLIPGCLVNVKWIAVPYAEKAKLSAYFHLQ